MKKSGCKCVNCQPWNDDYKRFEVKGDEIHFCGVNVSFRGKEEGIEKRLNDIYSVTRQKAMYEFRMLKERYGHVPIYWELKTGNAKSTWYFFNSAFFQMVDTRFNDIFDGFSIKPVIKK